MTEDDARRWIETRFGSSVTSALEKFVTFVEQESAQQNLVSRASLETIWARHIVDSAQLLDLARPDGLWIDVGTGAGFPGIVTAVASRRQTVLVEPRRRRVCFLQHVVEQLGLGAFVEVRHGYVETLDRKAGVISARAVATVADLLAATSSCSGLDTQFVLPKGRRAHEEVASAKIAWHGTFHVEHSITDPESMIVIASGISRR